MTKINYVMSQKGKEQLEHKGNVYVQEKIREKKIYWRCIRYTTKSKCRGRIHTDLNEQIIKETPHCHKPFESKKNDKLKPINYE